MAVYVVAYDLNNEKTRPPIVKDIKEMSGVWASLSESSYAVSIEKTAQWVFDRLKKHLDDDDNLYVIPMQKPYAGYGPKPVIQWLDENLPG